MDRKYNDWLCFLHQVDSNTDLLDNVLLKRVVVQPTEKLKNIGPHKLKSKTTMKKNHATKKNSGVWVCNYMEDINNQNCDGTNILQKHLLYTNKNLKNYPFIDISTSIPIFTWNLTKNYLQIISNNPFLIVYRILRTIRVSNSMLNHQVYQWKI